MPIPPLRVAVQQIASSSVRWCEFVDVVQQEFKTHPIGDAVKSADPVWKSLESEAEIAKQCELALNLVARQSDPRPDGFGHQAFESQASRMGARTGVVPDQGRVKFDRPTLQTLMQGFAVVIAIGENSSGISFQTGKQMNCRNTFVDVERRDLEPQHHALTIEHSMELVSPAPMPMRVAVASIGIFAEIVDHQRHSVDDARAPRFPSSQTLKDLRVAPPEQILDSCLASPPGNRAGMRQSRQPTCRRPVLRLARPTHRPIVQNMPRA